MHKGNMSDQVNSPPKLPFAPNIPNLYPDKKVFCGKHSHLDSYRIYSFKPSDGLFFQSTIRRRVYFGSGNVLGGGSNFRKFSANFTAYSMGTKMGSCNVQMLVQTINTTFLDISPSYRRLPLLRCKLMKQKVSRYVNATVTN